MIDIVKETFDFLGFTFRNGMSRKGNYIVIHHTSQKKSKAKKQAISEWLRRVVQYYQIPETIAKLNLKLNGMFRYYGICNNYRWMNNIRFYIIGELRKWLNRRSQKGKISWAKMTNIIKYNPIASPKIHHNFW